MPGDPRYADIDRVVEGEGPRGRSIVEALARKIKLSDRSVTQFVTAGRGAGLTTELNRLAEYLGRKDAANLLAVRVDAGQYLDLSSPIEPFDILIAIVAAVDEAMDVRGAPSRTPVMSRMWDRLVREIRTDVPVMPKLGLQLRLNRPLRDQIHKATAAHSSELFHEIRDALFLQRQTARELGYAGLVVLFDDLNRLSGMRSNVDEVTASVERVLFASHMFELPAHIVLTLPVWAAFIPASALQSVAIVPMIMVCQRDGSVLDPGRRAVREIIHSRFPQHCIEEVLGPDLDDRIERIARWSGGVPRAVVRLLRELVLEAELLPIADADFRRVLAQITEPVRRLLSVEDARYLRRVLADSPPHAGRNFVELLANGALLPYQEGDLWFGVHPG
ncbi:MAG: hypothetical protein ACREXU_19275, partial [Gammaproteobacteria bacterium]